MVALDGWRHFQESDFQFWKFDWHGIYYVSSVYLLFLMTPDTKGRRQRIRSMFWPKFGGVGTRLRLLFSLGNYFKIRFIYVMTYLGEGLFLTPNDTSYVLRGKWVESGSHIVVTCAFTYVVLFGSLEDKLKTKISLASMWQFVVWLIWKYRNDLTFSRKIVEVEQLTEKINFSPFKWYVSKCFGIPCTHYEWMMESIFCQVWKSFVWFVYSELLSQALGSSLTFVAPFEFMCN